MRSFALAMGLFWAGVEAATKRGSCADVTKTGVESFDEAAYLGSWYEIAKDSDFFDTDKSCSNETYQRKFNGELVVGKNTYDLDDKWTQKQLNAVPDGRVPDGPGNFLEVIVEWVNQSIHDLL